MSKYSDELTRKFIEALRQLNANDRQEVCEKVLNNEHFCPFCGIDHDNSGICHCRNDE